jgi:hypothetical protein
MEVPKATEEVLQNSEYESDFKKLSSNDDDGEDR